MLCVYLRYCARCVMFASFGKPAGADTAHRVNHYYIVGIIMNEAAIIRVSGDTSVNMTNI